MRIDGLSLLGFFLLGLAAICPAPLHAAEVKVLAVPGLEGAKSRWQVVLISCGKMGQPSWCSSLGVVNHAKEVVFQDAARGPLEQMSYVKEGSGLGQWDGKEVLSVIYLRGGEGLEADEVTMLIRYDGRNYRNSTRLLKSKGLEKLQWDEDLPEELKAFCRERWEVFAQARTAVSR